VRCALLTVTAPVKKNFLPELLEAQKMGCAIARDEVPESRTFAYRRASLNKPDPTTFYGIGPKGYTDYPRLDA
jgi:hypothetical protein